MRATPNRGGQPPIERPAGHLDQAWPGCGRRSMKEVVLRVLSTRSDLPENGMAVSPQRSGRRRGRGLDQRRCQVVPATLPLAVRIFESAAIRSLLIVTLAAS